MSKSKIEYKDLYAFHPGYYINDIIEDMEMTQEEFSKRVGTTPKTISKLVNGHIDLSNELASKLSIMLGTSIELWLNLQKKYDEKKLEIKKQEDFEKQKEVAEILDYKFFERLNVVDKAKNSIEKIENLCSFFKISNLSYLSRPDLLANFRTGISNVQVKNIICANAWLQTAINEAYKINSKPYNENKLIESIPKIREMTVKNSNDFSPELLEIFKECGVTFVLLPKLKNCGVNGVVKWINENKVLLAMNDRRLYSDVFWFSIFHEIKHVLQKNKKEMIISSKNFDASKQEEILEKEADDFAQQILIPTKEYNEFLFRNLFNQYSILQFSDKIGIHPGIVVGRLQHDKKIPNASILNSLKEKYKIN